MKDLKALLGWLGSYLRTVANSYTEIFFFENHLLGLVLVAATFINPNVGLAGLLCVISAYELARFLGLREIFRGSGYYTYNPLLVGLSIGFLFKITPLTIFFIVTAGLMTFVVTFSLAHVFYYFFRLPVINVPFVLVSTTIYLAAYRYSNLLVNDFYLRHPAFNSLDLRLPLWLTGPLKALGALLFSPHLLGGLIFLVVIFLASRILFFLAVSGYVLGVTTLALMKGSFYQALTDLSTFNFSLIAMAIGGVFLIPGPRSYILAAIAVVVSPFLLEAAGFFWAHYGIPAFTLPFNVVTLSFIYPLGLAGYPYLTLYYRGSPERTLDYYLSYLARFRGTNRTLTLPFSGDWTVWQGFDGPWTHKGIWRYALDFVITDAEGKTFSGQGQLLEDYYCFGKPVLSPVRGRVISLVNNIDDNPPGSVNEIDNWGNYVLIYDERGFYVLLAHFKRGSIKVSPGQWVEKGHLLGLCGNSGYSPQPHLHLQIQFSAELGAPTAPFSLLHYAVIKEGRLIFRANDIPKEGECLRALYPDKALESKFSFVLDEEIIYEVNREVGEPETLCLKVCMAPDGTYFFDSGSDRLYFSKDQGTFYLLRHDGGDEALKALFLALPRVPLVYQKELCWKDNLPLEAYFGPLKRALFTFMASFRRDLARVTGTYFFSSSEEIQGEVQGGVDRTRVKTFVRLDPLKGLSLVRVEREGQKITLRRVT
ncbi:peptidoglycan DD-metalloendopeptidase family protein [Thermosulfuriphilus ammonigenes]|uniref:Peptidoglycan DD-metalloendopeptidase family protein n=1 Tax=Thermosulfuriphilus ammonigenes TaxID=1936021 RepID=A0A6G7PWQ0_9BACT|nr:urea transporter [Thermosulfuriphilus ammonigenes]MBA2847930.1 urea transporter [Thermosulfuriphilus ammonigenes]QIJ71878.1 peptidoglycan DD-metalloendopeptidase family protein [Thermosulfuriphilus ammonigenes]